MSNASRHCFLFISKYFSESEYIARIFQYTSNISNLHCAQHTHKCTSRVCKAGVSLNLPVHLNRAQLMSLEGLPQLQETILRSYSEMTTQTMKLSSPFPL